MLKRSNLLSEDGVCHGPLGEEVLGADDSGQHVVRYGGRSSLRRTGSPRVAQGGDFSEWPTE